jgi:hypothetical protein
VIGDREERSGDLWYDRVQAEKRTSRKGTNQVLLSRGWH